MQHACDGAHTFSLPLRTADSYAITLGLVDNGPGSGCSWHRPCNPRDGQVRPAPREDPFGLRRVSVALLGSEVPPSGQKRRHVAALQKGHTPPNLSSGCRSPDLCYHKIRFRVDISQGHFEGVRWRA